jgi:hypothetical protein
LKLSTATVLEVFQSKKTELEKKCIQTLKELDIQIAVLELASAKAREAGASQTALQAEATMKKLIDVRADASRRFADALHDLAEQGQTSFGGSSLLALSPSG